MANPTKYTPELAQKIYEHLLDGKSLNAIAKLPGMPSRPTMLDWTNKHPEFDKLYDLAKEAQIEGKMDDIDALNDQMVEVAETEDDPKRANVRVHAIQNKIQNRIRLAQSLRRRKYGDKVQAEISGKDGGPLVFQVERIGRK
jgi:hypothetical protein